MEVKVFAFNLCGILFGRSSAYLLFDIKYYMSEQADNLERGRQEIWRREKLMIASVFLFLPYGIFVLMPTSHYIGQWTLPILIAVFLYGISASINGSVILLVRTAGIPFLRHSRNQLFAIEHVSTVKRI